jgi:flavin reductase (DIM6/NTAB) family NADH-FMN oxidoreductase RutF
VGPRPIGWISTVSNDGIPNLAPYSCFNMFAEAPPILAFSSYGYKDTVKNVQDTKEFVWNLCTKSLVSAMNITSEEVLPNVNEFEMAGLTAVASNILSVAPRVAESPVSFECRLIDLFRMKDSNQNSIDNWFVYGEVVGVHINQDMLINGIYDTSTAQHVLRGGERENYYEITPSALFKSTRPVRGPRSPLK